MNASNSTFLSNYTISLRCFGPKPPTYQEILEYINECLPYSKREEWIKIFMQHMNLKRQQSQMPVIYLVPILLLYIVMILFGACGSSLVVLVVIKRRQMQTPRNLFILNLAITDFILCSFTQPFNLTRLLSQHKEWTFGEVLCKMVSFFTGANMFVSTMSISAIAIDRFYVIMYPTRKALDNKGAMCVIILIWIFASLLASPLPLFSHVESVMENRHECTELSSNTFVREMKLVYSVFGMLFQYLFPLVILLTVYSRIYYRMKSRMQNQSKTHYSINDRNSEDPQTNKLVSFKEKKHILEANRQRKVNILLISIAVVFALGWLPLNINNLVMDIHLYTYNTIVENGTDLVRSSTSQSSVSYSQAVMIIQAICLLLVLSSACTNPILYSWLNENFRHEFQRLLFWKNRTNRANTSHMHFTNNGPTTNIHIENPNDIEDRA